ncbi:MAG: hypothetical protein R6V83_06155 [Candidatus Thorarchaeota archaeon]
MAIDKRKAFFLILAAFSVLQFLVPTNQPYIISQTTDGIVETRNARIEVTLGREESMIDFTTKVTNKGEDSLNQLEFRFDIRQMELHSSMVGGNNVSGTLHPEDRFTVLRLSVQDPIEANTTKSIEVHLSSETLTERLGLRNNGTLEQYQMIYYLRPINEHYNLTFCVNLQAHAVLNSENSASLFPRPDSNYTDGKSMGFVWKVEHISPGQAKSFIVKYGLPVTLIQSSADSPYGILFLILAGFGGAALVLILQKMPDVIRSFQPQVYTFNGSSRNEEEILRLITRKGGTCPQKVIYEELDFSQSMVSMLLNGLEERGIVRRFKDGRHNVVHLVEKE